MHDLLKPKQVGNTRVSDVTILFCLLQHAPNLLVRRIHELWFTPSEGLLVLFDQISERFLLTGGLAGQLFEMSDEGFPRVLLEVFLRLGELTPTMFEREELPACFVILRIRHLTALTRSAFQ